MEKSGIEEIVKAIGEEEDKQKALIFTNRIGVLLAENGVKVNTSEIKIRDILLDFKSKLRTEYSVDSLDFTEHDKPYKDEINALKEQIDELEAELEVKDNLLKIKNGLTGDTEDERTPIESAMHIIKNHDDLEIEQIVGHLEVYLKRDVF